MNPLLAIGAVLALMVLAVLATMVIENWRHLVTPAPIRRLAQRDNDGTIPDAQGTDAPGTDAQGTDAQGTPAGTDALGTPAGTRAALPDAAPASAFTRRGPNDTDAARPGALSADTSKIAIEAVPFHTPAGAPDGAVAFAGTSIAIRDAATADVLAGLLFAGLASTRRSGSDRAAAWVTAAATPPSADPGRLAPGVHLRGRSAKVAELLGHHDGGCVWVTLQPGVDIARGLARTPVTQPTLAGLVEWWRCTQTLPSVIEASTAATISTAVEAVRPQLDHTPWSEVVGRLHDALLQSAQDHEPIFVSIGIDDDSPRSADAPAPRPAPATESAERR